MIKAILFDLDNTLIDFMRMKKNSCEAAISAMIDAGLKINKEKAITALFKLYDKHGLEENKIFQKFLKEETGEVDYRILANAIVAYRGVRSSYMQPYPHTDYVLIKLKSKGIKLGIVTDAPKLKAWIRLMSMKIGNFFDVVVAYEDTKQLKPSSLPFEAALKKLKLKPEECLMVGDMPHRDVEGAKKLGIKTCFAKYGNQKIKESKADHEINDIKELLKIVN
ncbi:MAG: TIGR02253 family HAD-type hydrolase [Nanoarchaeota archaeon]|nr:TIGR02253 family HAD-type hydrolase [Nanoarchaeota archaeon]MBU1005923.1 TIGR02253 family HAD-type hydrolase [Nanoarchaeota archaeon]MBU1946289.1 TIGR02253 family HAD-type hydrolase [Nanoarchaeota archaeon]